MTDELEDTIINRKLFTQFCGQMYAELLKHRDEKLCISLKEMRPENVYSVCMLEIKKRLHMIESSDVELIRKQDIHMANYLFMMWVKMGEVEKLNR